MIQVEALRKTYGPNVAVDGVTFSVARGEILGFLGPNGAGKTTTMRILTGYMPPGEGRVTIDGLDAGRDAIEVRRRIGYLPESVPIYREQSVADYLSFVADVKGVPRTGKSAAIDRILEQTGLVAVRRRIVGRLSRGYRQRVGLAQALVNDPALLVLDEPTVGLDPGQVVEVRELIKSLAGRRTVILSTHILPEVSQLCSRVLIINKGRLVAEGTPQELTDRLQGRQAWRLRVAGDGRVAREVVLRVPGVLGAELVAGADGTALVRVEAEPGADLRGALARALVEAGESLLELAAASLSLEEIFLSLVREDPAHPAEAGR